MYGEHMFDNGLVTYFSVMLGLSKDAAMTTQTLSLPFELDEMQVHGLRNSGPKLAELVLEFAQCVGCVPGGN